VNKKAPEANGNVPLALVEVQTSKDDAGGKKKKEEIEV
jgi:hypothetical protein